MKSWKKPLIYCSSLLVCLVAGIAIIMACGPETDPYDYYVSFFHNNLQGQKEYRPFYYTSYQFVYDDNEPTREATINANEWSAYLGKDVNAADVERAMYHLSPHVDSILLNRYLKTGEKLPDSLSANTFLKALQLKKNTVALKYYGFAKSVEGIANTTGNKWNPQPLDSLALQKGGNQALTNAFPQTDKFIKLRYYYQAQRLLHYGGGYRAALNVYNKYIAINPSTSHIKGWALALKAGELRRLRDTVQAAYLFSKVFALYPERRVQAYRNYRYMNVKSSKVLALATNNSERAIIYAIDVFGNPDLNIEALQKVYQYDPTSPMVGVLLVREVNKLEERYLTHKLYSQNKLVMGFEDYNSADAEKQLPRLLTHITRLSNFCKQLVSEHKYPDYNIGNLAGAYLAWMHGDNTGGEASLAALNDQNLSPGMADQKQVIQLLLTEQSIQRFNLVNEAALLPALKWLDTKADTEDKLSHASQEFTDDRKFTLTLRNFYQQILAPAYLKQRDTLMAGLALSKVADAFVAKDFWQRNLHSAQIIRIIRWKKMPPTDPFLNFLTNKLNALPLNYLYELLGTAYLREHQYSRAVNVLKQVDIAYLNEAQPDEEKADPFIDLINDYPKVLRYGKAKGYNKLQFAEAMNEITEKIQSDPLNAPSYYYRFATGLYNTSHYGNSGYLISYNWTSTDFARKEKYSYDADYIKTKSAEKYYLLARSLSNNVEFKAKCTFMAAKCIQKQALWPNYGFGSDDDQKTYLRQIKSSHYFDELKAQYKKTDFFKKAVGECSYLKDYILTSK